MDVKPWTDAEIEKEIRWLGQIPFPTDFHTRLATALRELLALREEAKTWPVLADGTRAKPGQTVYVRSGKLVLHYEIETKAVTRLGWYPSQPFGNCYSTPGAAKASLGMNRRKVTKTA